MNVENPKNQSDSRIIQGLVQTIENAGENSVEAFNDLRGIAIGGHKEAQTLFLPIDQAVASGELILPIPVDVTETKIKKKSKVNKSKMIPPEHEMW